MPYQRILSRLQDHVQVPNPLPSPRPSGWQHQGSPGGWRYHRGDYSSSWSASLHYLSNGFGAQILTVALIAVAGAAAAFAVRRRANWIFGLNPAATCLALGSLAAVGVSTLTPRSNANPRSAGEVQLVPLATVRSFLDRPADLLIYIGGNVALFVPLGFFIYLALGPQALGGRVAGRRVLISTVICAAVSVCVEILQLGIWSRSSDVDDVLTNTAGGLLGALAALAVLRLYRSRRPAPPPEQGPPPSETAVQAVGSRAS
jgi:glycopeptide antibiotics resistance protein